MSPEDKKLQANLHAASKIKEALTYLSIAENNVSVFEAQLKVCRPEFVEKIQLQLANAKIYRSDCIGSIIYFSKLMEV